MYYKLKCERQLEMNMFDNEDVPLLEANGADDHFIELPQLH